MTGVDPDAAWWEPLLCDDEHPGKSKALARSAVPASNAADEDNGTRRYKDNRLAMVFNKRDAMCTRDTNYLRLGSIPGKGRASEHLARKRAVACFVNHFGHLLAQRAPGRRFSNPDFSRLSSVVAML